MKRYLFLFLSAFIIRLWIGLADPFLHSWDERFHALVSKNLMEDPLKPLLRVEPVLPYDSTSWTEGHIWVHKQPLFLWQIALSMKVFGVNIIGLRFPSIIMASIQVILIYRIAILLGLGFGAMLSALLFLFSSYQLEQTTGVIGMDHNDVAFGFYILLSFWSYFEHMRSQRMFWILMVGLFAGGAVLNKWLPGLLIYGAWIVNILFDKNYKLKDQFINIGTSFLVACAVFIPWQIYILNKFPTQAKFTYNFNERHITESLEGHTGNWDYFIRLVPYHYSYIIAFLILAFFIMVLKRKNLKPSIISLLFAISIVYIFFSFVVQTKSSNYVFIVAPFVFIIAGIGFDFIYEMSKHLFSKKVALLFITFLVCSSIVSVLKPVTLYNFHKNDKQYLFNSENRALKRYNTHVYKQLDSIIPERSIILNCRGFEDIEAMFWSKHNVYQWYPDSIQYQKLKLQDVKIATFPSMPNQPLPGYIMNDPDVFILPITLK